MKVAHVSHKTNTHEQVELDYLAVKSAAMTLRALNHKLRQQMIRLLIDNRIMNVTDIYFKLRLEQSVASQHLAILRRANIVITERDGKFIRYALNYGRIAEIANFVIKMQGDEVETIQSEAAFIGLNKAIDKIEKLKNLEDNWDDEDGKAIETKFIVAAKDLVTNQYRINRILPNFVAPTVNSGVLVEYKNNSFSIDFRFEKSGSTMTIMEAMSCLYHDRIKEALINQYAKKLL